MELVPIKNTVLVIVAAVATITIIISYTSHKIRQKKGLLDTPSIEKVKPNVEIKNSSAKPSAEIKQDINRITPDKKIEKQKKERMEQPPKKVQIEKKNTIPKNERIEIVKTVLPLQNPNEKAQEQKMPTPQKKSTEEVKLQSLGEKIIDKYDDKNSDAIFPLKVDKKKNVI